MFYQKNKKQRLVKIRGKLRNGTSWDFKVFLINWYCVYLFKEPGSASDKIKICIVFKGGGDNSCYGEDGTRFEFAKDPNCAGSLSVKRGQIPLLFYIWIMNISFWWFSSKIQNL